MTARSSFLRKICYIVGIAVLLILLFQFGRPPTRGGANVKSSPGGILAQKQKEYKLTQTELGDIDPTSETIKLATLGLRGVAALLLWEKSNDYKMREDWTKYEATLNQIAVVQPHFISVWIHLAWNLSYNVSVEFDNYHDRYHWVIEGIKYLQKGISKNDSDPRLLWETGWTVSQKIGRADEHKQYRRLFKEDDEFHGSSRRDDEYRDNWLVGKTWYDKCIEVAEATGKRVKGKGPLIYNSSPAMCLMNYAEAIEEEGTFGQVAQRAWRNAAKAWEDFGKKLIPDPDDDQLYLGNLEKHEELSKKLVQELNDLEPGLRDKIYKKKYDALTPEQREAFELSKASPEKLTEKQQPLASQAQAQLEISYEEIAKQVPMEKRAKALQLAKDALKNDIIAVDIRRSREVVNYGYWKLRRRGRAGRRGGGGAKGHLQGDATVSPGGRSGGARDLFNEGFLKWRHVLDKYSCSSKTH